MDDLLREIRACTVCSESLPMGPRPIVAAHRDSRILIIGQAPGRRVHETGVPWDDASGKRLRTWMSISDDAFYDPTKVALVPMGFCFPGTGTSGDRPPRPECAPLWHDRLLRQLPNIKLTLLLSNYALDTYLPGREDTLTATVKSWRRYAPRYLPLPHPSPRNNRWLKANEWFAEEVIPYLATRVGEALSH